MQYVLEQFDANPQFGPCVGISRDVRWHNAQRLGLNPENKVLEFIEKTGLRSSYLERLLI